MASEFWENQFFDSRINSESPDYRCIQQMALRHKQSLFTLNSEVRKCSSRFYKRLVDFLKSRGGVPAQVQYSLSGEPSPTYFWWENKFVSVSQGWESGSAYVTGKDFQTIYVSVASLEEDFIKELRTFFRRGTQPIPERKKYPREVGNFINAIIKTMGGYQIHRIGWVEAPLILENYTPEVREGYAQILSDLKTGMPKGKIAILDGPPGTGKTYLVRGLITALRGYNFLLVPPDMIEEFGKPEMLPFLLNHQSQNTSDDDDDEDDCEGDDCEGCSYCSEDAECKETKPSKFVKPLVLVMEDADALLSKRQASSMDAVASALNLGDGILGDALNIRIITTTNSPIDEMDPAMLRPGRLSARVQVGKLDVQTGREIMRRIKPHAEKDYGDLVVEPMTLAEIYALSK